MDGWVDWQVDWLVEVDEFLDSDEEPDLDKDGLEQLKELLETGKALCSHASIESALGKISGLLTQVSYFSHIRLSKYRIIQRSRKKGMSFRTFHNFLGRKMGRKCKTMFECQAKVSLA